MSAGFARFCGDNPNDNENSTQNEACDRKIGLDYSDASRPNSACFRTSERVVCPIKFFEVEIGGNVQFPSLVINSGGNLYFSVPVGKPRVCFNAHRIHSLQQILDYFCDLQLVQFSGINDDGTFRQEIEPSDLADATYACGLFHFTKEP